MAKPEPLHPGEVLRQEFMAPRGITVFALATACQIDPQRLERISADIALSLSEYFGTNPVFGCGASRSGLFAMNREISVCARLRGGAGRTRTSNQTIISRVL
jgi:addiction module HigA family antidote